MFEVGAKPMKNHKIPKLNTGNSLNFIQASTKSPKKRRLPKITEGVKKDVVMSTLLYICRLSGKKRRSK